MGFESVAKKFDSQVGMFTFCVLGLGLVFISTAKEYTAQGEASLASGACIGLHLRCYLQGKGPVVQKKGCSLLRDKTEDEVQSITSQQSSKLNLKEVWGKLLKQLESGLRETRGELELGWQTLTVYLELRQEN